MTEHPLRIGIIGTGVGVRTLVPGFRWAGPVEIAALSGSSTERAVEIGQDLDIRILTGDYSEICRSEEVDLICVTSPNEFHLEHARAALATEKHVYLEKPTGITAGEASEIAQLAHGSRRLVVVGHQLRFNPFFRAARDIVSAGELGRVYYMTIEQRGPGLGDPRQPWTWEFEGERGGGVRLAMGSHMLDLAGFILGEPIGSICSSLDPVHRTRYPGGGGPRSSSASVFFDSLATVGDATLYVSTTAAAHAEPCFNVAVYGERADLTFSLPSNLRIHKPGGLHEDVLSRSVVEEYESRPGSSIFSASFSYFAKEILTAIDSGMNTISDAATPESVVSYMVALDAARESFIDGTRVQLGPWQRQQYT